MKEKTSVSIVLLKLPKSSEHPANQKELDEALVVLEAVLRKDLRYQDQFLRYQETSLVGILAETDEVGAKSLQKRVVEAIHRDARLKDLLVLSGTATYPSDGDSIQSLLKVAESRALGQSQAS